MISEISSAEIKKPQIDTESKFDPDKRIDISKTENTTSREEYDPDKRVNVSETEKQDKPVEKIKCINEELDGSKHRETGVSFVKKYVEFGEKILEVVAPIFDSKFDVQLSMDKLNISDKEQFKICNSELKEAVLKDENLKNQFTKEQLEQIMNGDTPDGYVWHHDVEVGKMQLVDFETHQKTGHTGGRSIWGGGKDNR